MQPLLKERDRIVAEIELLLEEHSPDWKERIYITTRYVSSGINKHPEKYPILCSRNKATVNRWISWYLRETGRVDRNVNHSKGRAVWMLPGAAI
jgi:hypothetical protein